ncbi:MAG: trypsin-like peptidase domain-containing protein, partial [Spirochaetota bacterium]
MRASVFRTAGFAMLACSLLVLVSSCASLPKAPIAPAHYSEAKQAELRKLAETDRPRAIEGLVDLLGAPDAASEAMRPSFTSLLSELLSKMSSDYSTAFSSGKLDRALSLRLSLLALAGDKEASACLDAVGRKIQAEGRPGLAQEELAAAEKAAAAGSAPRAEQLLRALLRDLPEIVAGDPSLGQRAQALAGLLGLSWSSLLEGAQTLRLSPRAQIALPLEAVPALRSLEPSMVATVAKGVVTVRVDRGIKIEQGVGTLDRMIGSGFFIDPRGYLITNYHVIASEVDPAYEGFSRVALKLAGDSDSRIVAKVIGWDPLLDIALLKVDMKPAFSFRIGRSGLPPQGQAVYAFGSPAGLDSTITSGIVSAVGRKFLEWGDVFQIDAALNPGNSGGPVLDADGEVRGIAFAGLTNFQGLNFAIPAEWLLAILPTLYEGGKVAWPWLGLQLGDSTTLSPGLEVLYSHPSAPATIHEGGRILSVDGHALSKVVELQA